MLPTKECTCATDHAFDRRGSVILLCAVLGSLKKVVTMLAEIFMVRLEAASSSRFVPFTLSNQFLFKDRTARPADRNREAGDGEVS